MPPKKPEEAESTSGMSTYYLCSCVIYVEVPKSACQTDCHIDSQVI